MTVYWDFNHASTAKQILFFMYFSFGEKGTFRFGDYNLDRLRPGRFQQPFALQQGLPRALQAHPERIPQGRLGGGMNANNVGK